jgi:hypothetical protein
MIVKNILQNFYQNNKIAIFYVITNMYSHTIEQFEEQISGAKEIMESATGYTEDMISSQSNLIMLS